MNQRLTSSTRRCTPIAFVVAERRDVALLRALFAGTEFQDSRFFAAQGEVSLASLARNILIKEGVPVMVIVDVDEANREKERSETLRAIEVMQPVAPFDVFIFSPSLAAVFLQAIGQLHEGPATSVKYVGPLDPHALETLLGLPQVQSFLKSVNELQVRMNRLQHV